MINFFIPCNVSSVELLNHVFLIRQALNENKIKQHVVCVSIILGRLLLFSLNYHMGHKARVLVLLTRSQLYFHRAPLSFISLMMCPQSPKGVSPLLLLQIPRETLQKVCGKCYKKKKTPAEEPQQSQKKKSFLYYHFIY